ncbi:MAG: cupin [Cyanobacteria bacterium P01_F01_bin.56]
MGSQDWYAIATGDCQPCKTPRDWDLLETPYRFYRFLMDVEDVLKPFPTVEKQLQGLSDLRQLVRKIVLNSYWLRTQKPNLFDTADIAILNLYDEIGYPLTVQIETIQPGAQSPIHNHGTWGIVAIIEGQKKTTFWHRTPEPNWPDKITPVADRILTSGDVISFLPDAIHHIQALGEALLVTFNMYGETHSKHRFEFNAITHTARHY